MGDFKEFQQKAVFEIAKAREIITERCAVNIQRWEEGYKNAYKRYKKITKIWRTIILIIVISFCGFLCYYSNKNPQFPLTFFIFVALFSYFIFMGIVHYCVVGVFEDALCKSTLRGLKNFIIDQVNIVLKETISKETQEGILNVVQAIEANDTPLFQENERTACCSEIRFYYSFPEEMAGETVKLELKFSCNASFKGKTFIGLPRSTSITFSEDLSYQHETWSRLF